MTTVGVMVYAVAVGSVLAPAAWLLENGLAGLGLPTRWVWVGSLVLCLGLPVLGALTVAQATPKTSPYEPSAGAAVSIETAAAGAGAQARGVLDGVAVRLSVWRARLDRGVSLVVRTLAEGLPGLNRWLAVAWGLGSLAMAAVLIASTSKLSRRASDLPRQVLLGRAVRIAPDLGPATLKLTRPEIVVPSWAAALPPHRLELVLTHEEEHVRARDPLLLAIGLGAVVAYPWNFALWWQHRRLRDAVEVDCDRRVLGRGTAASSYGDLLVWMGTHRQLAWLPATTMKGSKSLLERRLKSMKKTELSAALPRTIGASILACGLVALACTTEPPVAGNSRVADVWVQPDGQVYINDMSYRSEDVSGAVERLEAASEDQLVIAIAADPAVPYAMMDQLLKELRTLRVAFSMREAPLRTPPGDPSEVVEGLRMVLPEQSEEVRVSGRNLLHLVVRPSGVVEVLRGGSTEVRRVRPADVEAIWRQGVVDNPNLIAAVKTHPGASYAHMLEVLDALHAAEAQRISLQTLVEPEAAAAR